MPGFAITRILALFGWCFCGHEEKYFSSPADQPFKSSKFQYWLRNPAANFEALNLEPFLKRPKVDLHRSSVPVWL
jgi:hypothetical protein